MQSATAPQSPEDALAFLVALDPAFETELEDERSTDLTYHRIMRLFASYLGANGNALPLNKVRLLCGWLNASVAAGGDIENAVSTCLLEHAHQLRVHRLLSPHLSAEAKRRLHA